MRDAPLNIGTHIFNIRIMSEFVRHDFWNNLR